jgi:hypothetical protein
MDVENANFGLRYGLVTCYGIDFFPPNSYLGPKSEEWPPHAIEAREIPTQMGSTEAIIFNPVGW